MPDRRLVLPLLQGLLLLVSAPGCAGSRIRADFTTHQAAPVQLTRAARPSVDAGAAPYQLALRLSPHLLDQTLSAVLPDNLLEGEQFKGMRPQGNKRPADMPRGPFGGRFLDRLAGAMGGMRDGGGADTLTPTLHANETRVGFSRDCDGCLKLRMDMTGGLKGADERGIELGGELVMRARLASTFVDDAPALGVRLEDVEHLRLELPISLPGPFSQIQSRMEDALRDRLSEMISSNQEQAQQVIPLRDRFNLGPGVKIEGLGVHTDADGPGELFIGLNTNLTAPGTVTMASRGDALKGDWGIVIGEETVSQLVRLAMKSGNIPTRYNRKGQPDPEGPVALDLGALHFSPEGFQIDARIWYLSFPAWWRDYRLSGTFELRDGRIATHITRMDPGAGDGATWVSRFVEKRVTSERAAKGIGRTVPTELPLMLEGDRKARLVPTTVHTLQGALLLAGRLEITGKGESRPAHE